MPRHRRNPPLPPAPSKRRFAGHQPSPQQLSSSLARVRKMSHQLDERERPFSPERRGSWQGSSRDLVVNGVSKVKGVPLDRFTMAFLEAALFSSTDESREDGGDPLDDNYTIHDFNEKCLRGLAEDCQVFQEENADAISVGPTDGSDADVDAGHDFWFTRCGHGVGFWDGDWPEPQATQLDEASKRFGNVDLYLHDGEIYAGGYEDGESWALKHRMKRNGEQAHFPFGSKRAGALEIPMPDFDWEQIDGDVNLPQYGGIIARCEDGQIDLVEIQPVREYVGDGEAKDVGFPFWTKEAAFDADGLDPSNNEVRKALESSDVDLDDMEPEHRARAIAVALMRYGHAEESDGGWAGDKKPGEEGRANLLGSRKVRWGYAGLERKTFEEEAGGDDDDFRREVLGTSAPFTYKISYEVVTPESAEDGEADDRGWEVEESGEYDSLEDVLNAGDIKHKSWVEWSDSNPDGKRSWLISEADQDIRSGADTTYNLWIERADGKPKSQEEIDTINEKLGISTFGRMRRKS